MIPGTALSSVDGFSASTAARSRSPPTHRSPNGAPSPTRDYAPRLSTGLTFNAIGALIQGRYMYETGSTPEDMAEVCVSLRKWAKQFYELPAV